MIGTVYTPGGRVRVLANLSKILSDIGVEMHIICRQTKPGGSLPYQFDKRVIIHHLGLGQPEKMNLWQKIKFNIKTSLMIRDLVKQYKFDIVCGLNALPNSLLPFFVPNSKKVAYEHDCYEQASKVVRLLRKIFYPFLDAVVLLTDNNASYYNFIPKRKRFVIPNSLPFVCDTPSNCQNKRIITLGRLVQLKGYNYLLQAAVKLKQEIPDWHIDIYGSGNDEVMLKDLAKKLQVDDFVTFNPPTKEVSKELCNSGMFVLSSRSESFGMVLIEAQECGLPIVSFDCPEGPSEVVHDGEDGFLVPLADTDALAEKIITLAKDQEMRKRFGQAAKINCQQFSPEKVGEMWMDLIAQLTKKKKK